MLYIEDFDIGDSLYVPLLNNLGHYTGLVGEEKITDIEQDTVTVGKAVPYKLSLSKTRDCFEFTSDDGFTDHFFRTIAQAREEIKRDKLWRAIRSKTSDLDSLTTEQLEEIALALDVADVA